LTSVGIEMAFAVTDSNLDKVLDDPEFVEWVGVNKRLDGNPSQETHFTMRKCT